MTTWVVLLVYAAGYLFTYRRVYVAMYESLRGDTGDAMHFSIPSAQDARETTTEAAVVAMMCSLFWPLVIVGWLLWRAASPTPPSQKRDELRRREQWIADRERELGIHGDD